LLVRARYAASLNSYPLITPAVIFLAVLAALAPVFGVYAGVIAVVLAAKLTEYW
jgi:hypothetical protein